MKQIKSVVATTACAVLLSAASSQAETLTYTYDALGRLSGAVSGNATTIYRHDAADNRRNVTIATVDANRKPVFRFWSGAKHFYSASYLEGNGAGFGSEGVGFTLFPVSGTGKAALYRCYNSVNGEHFLSLSNGCAGYTLESTLGYVATATSTGLRELYWFQRNVPNRDNLFTASYSEGANNGYTYMGSMGFVM